VSSTSARPRRRSGIGRSSAAAFVDVLGDTRQRGCANRRSSPRASAGFACCSRHRALGRSRRPPAYALVDETGCSPFESSILFDTDFRRSSNSPRYFCAGEHRAQIARINTCRAAFGHIAGNNAAARALRRAVANARLLPQHGLFSSAAQHPGQRANLSPHRARITGSRAALRQRGRKSLSRTSCLHGLKLLSTRILVGSRVACRARAQRGSTDAWRRAQARPTSSRADRSSIRSAQKKCGLSGDTYSVLKSAASLKRESEHLRLLHRHTKSRLRACGRPPSAACSTHVARDKQTARVARTTFAAPATMIPLLPAAARQS